MTMAEGKVKQTAKSSQSDKLLSMLLNCKYTSQSQLIRVADSNEILKMKF